MYCFCKIKGNKGDDGKWYLLADSIQVITEHYKKYCAVEIKEGMKQLLTNRHSHLTHKFAFTIERTAEATGKSVLETAVLLENKILMDRISNFQKEVKQYLSHGLIVRTADETEIIETRFSDTLVFPDELTPTLKDVRYINWPGGVHYYAKCGSFDVVDQYGNQKWNSLEAAQNAAEWYVANFEKNKDVNQK